MTVPFRFFILLLLTTHAAWAANFVRGQEVVALKGSSIVFRGFTDGQGRFATGPLEPGVYTVELRTPKGAPPTSARYFLALAGAKPLGDAVIRPGVALAMQAQVRRGTGIKGQVSARGGMVYVQPPSPTPAVSRNIGMVTPPVPLAQATPAPRIPLRRPSPTPAPSPVVRLAAAKLPAVPNAPAPRVNNPTPPRLVPANSPAPLPTPATYPPRIINGQRYFWTPIAPGSKLGRWISETVSAPPAAAAPSPARTSSSPQAKPRAKTTRKRQ